MNDERILPCPFCGGKDIRFDCHKDRTSPTREVWSMCCYNCGAQFPNRYKKELLLKAWNTRYNHPLDFDGKLVYPKEMKNNKKGTPGTLASTKEWEQEIKNGCSWL